MTAAASWCSCAGLMASLPVGLENCCVSRRTPPRASRSRSCRAPSVGGLQSWASPKTKCTSSEHCHARAGPQGGAVPVEAGGDMARVRPSASASCPATRWPRGPSAREPRPQAECTGPTCDETATRAGTRAAPSAPMTFGRW
eukprot:5546420-Prymnesium_polylepis.1